MDEIALYNQQRWDALVRARAVFTRPWLDLTPEEARARVDPDGLLGALEGKQVLVLAGGGGQQSAALAMLGAQVTVFDLSPAQLQRGQEAAAYYHQSIRTEQGDMRDLSRFGNATFDCVNQPYSLNFVPDARLVFREVARVLRPGGLYWFNCANPFFIGLTAGDWDGQGYPLRRPYVDSAEIHPEDEAWVFGDERPAESIAGSREYRHTLSTLINGLAENGFVLTRLIEENLAEPDAAAAPGTNEHFTAIAPPWLRFWTRWQPGFQA
jgi:SAM-dependent methyltransferase